ncbi:MAG: hypothetical protein QXV01_07925 [Candidatus Bathyarchaeia archaeon]
MVTTSDWLKGRVSDILLSEIGDVGIAEELEQQLLQGALSGLEIPEFLPTEKPYEVWLEQRFRFQLIWLDRDDYVRALVRALWLAPKFAATDFGGARQRDFAQVWTDTARGFLGEIALQKFLKEKLNTEVALDVRRGELEEFLPSDIKIKDQTSHGFRPTKIGLSIKTTKFNGRWLDLPGAQFDHSDAFVLVKIGISRMHFSAFLKDISFLRDKLFAVAKHLGELSDNQAEELWKETPNFTSIPAYVAGFIEKRELTMPIHQISCNLKGRKNKRIVISHGVGLFSLSTARTHPDVRKIDPSGTLPIEVEPIIDSLTEGKHFLAHSGALKFGYDAWKELVSRF